MDSANGKNGEKDCILHHTVEMKQSHPMTEPTRKGREHFSAFSLFITKCLKGITGLGCVFSVLQHTENELQRKNGVFRKMWDAYQTSVQWKVSKEGQTL